MCGPNLAFTALLKAAPVLKFLGAASPTRGCILCVTTEYLETFCMCCLRLAKLRLSSWIIYLLRIWKQKLDRKLSMFKVNLYRINSHYELLDLLQLLAFGKSDSWPVLG